MRYKSNAIMIVLALTALSFPLGAADAVMEEDYISLGVREGATGQDQGLGIFWPSAEGCGHYTPCKPNVGGVRFHDHEDHEIVELRFADDLSDAPMSQLCAYASGSDDECDATAGPACGTRYFDPGITFRTLSVFVHTLHVLPSLDVCLGSTGTVTAVYS